MSETGGSIGNKDSVCRLKLFRTAGRADIYIGTGRFNFLLAFLCLECFGKYDTVV